MCTRGRSSAQSVEKKRHDDQGRGDAGNTPGRNCRPIRGAALSSAGPSTAAGSPKRSHRLASPRHVAMGMPAGRRNSPARAVPRPNIHSNGAVLRTRRKNPVRKRKDQTQHNRKSTLATSNDRRINSTIRCAASSKFAAPPVSNHSTTDSQNLYRFRTLLRRLLVDFREQRHVFLPVHLRRPSAGGQPTKRVMHS